MLPLKDITVVSIEQAIAAPFATRQLADLGARVIKIERPGGGDFARYYDDTVHGLSSHFIWTNRSKESMTLDLKSDEGKKILEKLISKADVFVQNLAPGSIDRLGFGAERLHKDYPELIICGISGFGSYGSYKDKKAYDLLIQCEAGLISITGTEEVPSKTGVPIADIAAGVYAYSGILSAIIKKMKTNQGSILEISMLEALGEWMGYPLYYSYYGGEEPQRTGARHATIYPYGPFKAGDNKNVFFAIQNEREWFKFCKEVLKNESLADNKKFNSNGKRLENKEELEKIILEAFKQMTSEQVIERLEKANIANANLNSVMDFAKHPQLKERNRWRETLTETGTIKTLVPPITIEGVEPVMNPVPRVGEHTEKILKELENDSN